jgi:serine/threonine protein kinase
MEFNFPQVEGTGIPKLIPQASPEVVDLIQKLLIYNPDNRITASLAVKHPWFKELRE